VALDKSYAEAWNNLGLAHKNRGDYDQAITCFTEALRLKPGLAEAHWNRSSVNLLVGDFAQGLKDYEWRYHLPAWQLVYPFRTRLPRWDGSADLGQRYWFTTNRVWGHASIHPLHPHGQERCGKVILKPVENLWICSRNFPESMRLWSVRMTANHRQRRTSAFPS
jgi:tetratricopeptide (TPR) repeat protein